MKKIFVMLLFSFLIWDCTSQTTASAPENNKEENSLKLEKNDEDEYDIIVLDPQYETYLKSIAMPMNHYSEQYYKSKNEIYVTEWNIRHAQPMRYDPDFYAVSIDYNPQTDYGIKLEYKLYNFFQFINWKYKVNLGFDR